MNIRTMMAQDFNDVNHQYDPWHFLKVNSGPIFNLRAENNVSTQVFDNVCSFNGNSEYPNLDVEHERQTDGAVA